MNASLTSQIVQHNYKLLLEKLDTFGNLLQEADLGIFDDHQISFEYLSYDFNSSHHCVIFEDEIALKLRFTTFVFSESVYFEVVINLDGKIQPLNIIDAEPIYLAYLSEYNISRFIHSLVAGFLRGSDFFYVNLEANNEQ